MDNQKTIQNFLMSIYGIAMKRGIWRKVNKMDKITYQEMIDRGEDIFPIVLED